MEDRQLKSRITIELNGDWVLRHQEDEELPISLLKSLLEEKFKVEEEDSTYTTLVLVFDEETTGKEALTAGIKQFFEEKYAVTDAEQVFTVNFGSTEEKKEEPAKEQKKEKDTEVSDLFALCGLGEKKDAKDILKEIKDLVGAEEFKALAEEVVAVAPALSVEEKACVFYNQCYLFSVGDGYGLSTYLRLFAQLIDKTGLRKMHSRLVREISLGEYRDNDQPFEEARKILYGGDGRTTLLLSIDISEWIGKTETKYFKQFLREVEKSTGEFIIVFRVPFVEKDVLERLRYSLADLLRVRSVSFPPFSMKEIRSWTKCELSRCGYEFADDAWEPFMQCISEEKSDGKFYGLNTIRKVLQELFYRRELQNAEMGGSNFRIIAREDVAALCRTENDDTMSGEEQLASLIGIDKIRDKIHEIVAQIAMAKKTSAKDCPCIHMRFVGNPGTGKTTVARILGRILKEAGVLRIGNLYEYAGRDFCGQYVGETAPKTASICRDAYGSVLFIDEAYTLFRSEDNPRDYGREAIDTLIAEMENHRNDFVVIMAGYTDDMERLMKSNEGLASRMPYVIEFPSYSREDLYRIFVSMAEKKFKCDEDLLAAAHDFFLSLSDEFLGSKSFSNARFVRNLFERTWAKAAMRCQLDKQAEFVLTRDDFERASAEKEFGFHMEKKTRLGF